MMIDPNGEFAGLAMLFCAFAGEFVSNLIEGDAQPLKNAFNFASEIVSTMSNLFQYPIVNTKNFVLTAGLDPFAFGVSMNAHILWGDANPGSISFGVGYGAFSGFFANIGVSQSIGDFRMGAGMGIGEQYWAWAVSADYAGYGLAYGQTNYGGEHAQTVGSASVLFPNGSVTLQNDFLAFQGEDRWLSNAVELTIGKFSIGTWLYNNDPKNNGGRAVAENNLLGYPNRPYKKGFLGAWDIGETFASPLYVGYRIGSSVSRIGYSHPLVQDRTQNFVHRWVPFGRQNYYNKYNYFQAGSYLYSGYYSAFSIWHQGFNIY
jgi:hypothetical protein